MLIDGDHLEIGDSMLSDNGQITQELGNRAYFTRSKCFRFRTRRKGLPGDGAFDALTTNASVRNIDRIQTLELLGTSFHLHHCARSVSEFEVN